MSTPSLPMPGKKRPNNWPNAKGHNNLVPPMVKKPKVPTVGMPKKAC